MNVKNVDGVRVSGHTRGPLLPSIGGLLSCRRFDTQVRVADKKTHAFAELSDKRGVVVFDNLDCVAKNLGHIVRARSANQHVDGQCVAKPVWMSALDVCLLSDSLYPRIQTWTSHGDAIRRIEEHRRFRVWQSLQIRLKQAVLELRVNRYDHFLLSLLGNPFDLPLIEMHLLPRQLARITTAQTSPT